jgi:hypothetical protein
MDINTSSEIKVVGLSSSANEVSITAFFNTICNDTGGHVTSVTVLKLNKGSPLAFVSFSNHEAAKKCVGKHYGSIGANVIATLSTQETSTKKDSLSSGLLAAGAGEASNQVHRLKKRKAEEIDVIELFDSDKAVVGIDDSPPIYDCEICKENIRKSRPIFCNANKHALCKDCLDNYAKSQLAEQRIGDGSLRCTRDRDGMKPEERCKAPPWSINELTKRLCRDTLALLITSAHQAVQAKQSIIDKQRKDAEQAREDKAAKEKREAEKIAKQLAAAAMLAQRSDRLNAIRNTLIEEVMYTRCGRCQTPFDDYDGCGALTCCNKTCAAGFCALCLIDCGTDAHPHLQQAHGNVWVKKEEFNQIHQDRRRNLLQQKFDSLVGVGVDAAFKQDLLKAMIEDLRGVGLRFEDINVPIVPQAQVFTGAGPEARAGLPQQGLRLIDTPDNVLMANFQEQLAGMLGRPLTEVELTLDAETLQEQILRCIEPNLVAMQR